MPSKRRQNADLFDSFGVDRAGMTAIAVTSQIARSPV